MIRSILLGIAVISVVGTLLAGGGVIYALYYYSRGLPDFRQLADYEPPTTSRLHAADGRLMAEYARQKRVYVPIQAMPQLVIDAFVAAEDKNFFVHKGVDFVAVLRAIVRNLQSSGRPEGASTITQQVAKNFLLTNEVSYERKIREMILAFRIEKAFSKNRILELYLNEIFLGRGSYGVAAASLNYFNKSLDELTVAETSFLAGLPKAPSRYDPEDRPEAALARRDYVIGRMREDDYVSAEEAAFARETPIETRRRETTEIVIAEYFAEEVRRQLVDRYGEIGVYEGGLSVRTTLDPRLQRIADRALRDGLVSYDRRHGWRGAFGRLEDMSDWPTSLAAVRPPDGGEPWLKSVVIEVGGKAATVGLEDGTTLTLPFAEMRWARAWAKDQRVGAAPRKPGDVVSVGDLILVEPVTENADGEAYPENTVALRQIPDVNGGLIAIDPHSGRVLAMSGGWSFDDSVFNRATQARRQPGSAFKPFVYLAALDNGFTPATLMLDAPFVHCPPPNAPDPECWRPDNYDQKFHGPSTLRMGMEKSRNLMTVRLAQTISMQSVADYAERFEVVDDLQQYLPVALGAAETTLLDITTAYARLVNGGKRIEPSLIDRVQDRDGRTIYRHDARPCRDCRGPFTGTAMPILEDSREQLVDPGSAYQVISLLEGVVKRGTGVRAWQAMRPRPLGGKTGTTNDFRDAWFIGFSPDLVVGTYIGFDQPRTLGKKEAGSRAALPIFIDFMQEALKDTPPTPFRVPEGLRMVFVDRVTGERSRPGAENAIAEWFKPGTEPKPGEVRILDVHDEMPFGDQQAGQPVPGGQTGGFGVFQPSLPPTLPRVPQTAPSTGTGGFY